MKTIPNWTYQTLVLVVNVSFVLTVLHLFGVIELPKMAQGYMAGFSLAFMLVLIGYVQVRRAKRAALPRSNAR